MLLQCMLTAVGEAPHCLASIYCFLHVALQVKNEQLSSIVRKVQGEGEFLLKQTAVAVEKQERLAAQLGKLTRSLEQTEENIKRTAFEEKVMGKLNQQRPGLIAALYVVHSMEQQRSYCCYCRVPG